MKTKRIHRRFRKILSKRNEIMASHPLSTSNATSILVSPASSNANHDKSPSDPKMWIVFCQKRHPWRRRRRRRKRRKRKQIAVPSSGGGDLLPVMSQPLMLKNRNPTV